MLGARRCKGAMQVRLWVCVAGFCVCPKRSSDGKVSLLMFTK